MPGNSMAVSLQGIGVLIRTSCSHTPQLVCLLDSALWGLRACLSFVWLGSGQGMNAECVSCEGRDGIRGNCRDILFRQLLNAGGILVYCLFRDKLSCISGPKDDRRGLTFLVSLHTLGLGWQAWATVPGFMQYSDRTQGFKHVVQSEILLPHSSHLGPSVEGLLSDLAVSAQLWAINTLPFLLQSPKLVFIIYFQVKKF